MVRGRILGERTANKIIYPSPTSVSYETMKFIIRKQNGKFMQISFERNYIFFRPRRTKQFYLNKKLLEISENL